MMKTLWSFVLTALSLGAALSQAIASEKDLYDFLWLDPDKKVYVLQNKIYPKTNTFYVDVGYMNNLTNDFQNTNGGQLRLGYFLNEEFALELNHAQYTSVDNTAFEAIQKVNGTEPFIRRNLKLNSLFLIWSPFYGKLNTFNKIFYFDVYFGAGSGTLEMESNMRSVTDPSIPSTFTGETVVPAQFKAGFKLHVNRQIHLGVEFLNHNFQAGSPKQPSSKKWKQSNDLIFSLGVSF